MVLVSDESDHGVQPRAFEQLLGLPDGQLTPGPHTNTSFSMERIELCRQVNLAVEAHDWVGNRRLNGPRRAMLAGMRVGADPGLRDVHPAAARRGPPHGSRRSATSGPAPCASPA